MTEVNNLTKINGKYVQNAGFIGIIPMIGEFLVKVVVWILVFIYNLFRALFAVRFNFKQWWTLYLTLGPGEGMFYKFLWFSMKCGVYLVIFAFGGPLIAMIGIIFMYKNLFKKMGELKKDDDAKEDNKGGDKPPEGEK